MKIFAYTAPPGLLHDRVILVTGAGDGLGRAAALAYAAHGATVLLLGRTEQKLAAVYDTIVASGAPEPAMFVLDLEKAGDNECNEVANIIAGEFGHLDGMLNNVGMFAPIVPLEHHSLETWNRLLQVNLTSTFLITRSCLPLLRSAPHASLVFTSSAAGRMVRAYWGAYAIAKHGIETMMQIFHQELSTTTSIRVNTLNPGPCATALRKVGFPHEDQSTLPSPDDLMPVYLYLMGDDSIGESGKQFDAQGPITLYDKQGR
jgi:NAD(P)-dependent dehydrogenase (short-subunit alcohol dehydrogenase family)